MKATAGLLKFEFPWSPFFIYFQRGRIVVCETQIDLHINCLIPEWEAKPHVFLNVTFSWNSIHSNSDVAPFQTGVKFQKVTRNSMGDLTRAVTCRKIKVEKNKNMTARSLQRLNAPQPQSAHAAPLGRRRPPPPDQLRGRFQVICLPFALPALGVLFPRRSPRSSIGWRARCSTNCVGDVRCCFAFRFLAATPIPFLSAV